MSVNEVHIILVITITAITASMRSTITIVIITIFTKKSAFHVMVITTFYTIDIMSNRHMPIIYSSLGNHFDNSTY